MIWDFEDKIWWALTGSNRRHSACKADALPTELSALSEYKQSETLSKHKRKIINIPNGISYQRSSIKILVKTNIFLKMHQENGAADGARTRDPRRDRPVF